LAKLGNRDNVFYFFGQDDKNLDETKKRP